MARIGKKSMARRWFITTVGVVVVILVVFISAFAVTIQSSLYSSIEQTLTGRVDELMNWLSADSGGLSSSSEFLAITRDYIETFSDKNEMEIMGLTRSGRIFVTSTGFEPEEGQEMPDYTAALQSGDDTGKWVGRLSTGEKVMAITRVVRAENGTLAGSVRYLVSLELADRQVRQILLVLILVGLFILIIIVLSNVYLVRSILIPIRLVNGGAEKIAKGDFNVRIEKERDDELGALVDSINDMALELGAAERMENDFISSISHELRTPLTSIKGWAETLQSGADRATEEKGMGVIIHESERLSGLVEELLDFSRLQSGRMKLRASRLELLSELDETVFLFTERARAENKELKYDENAVLPPVYGDAAKLRQVFVNIIDNAIKYTEPGGSITVSGREAGGFVKVCVSDTGCGIPEDQLPNVKKKFYKANQFVPGSGIGLAVADEIVGMHGGTLDIQSSVNVGTTVTISLPSCRWLEAHPEISVDAEIAKLLGRDD